MSMTDEALMAEFQKTRSSEAIDLLIRRHSGWAFNAARSLLPCAEDAEDATQQAFIDLMRACGTYRTDAPFRPWFGRIVVNACRQQARADRRRTRREEAAVGSREDKPMNPLPESVRSALHDLDTELKAPLVLCYLEGFTQAEAADALGVPPRTMSDAVRRGLEAIRKRLGLAGVAAGMPDIQSALQGLPRNAVPPALAARLEVLPRQIDSILSSPPPHPVSVSSAKAPWLVAVVGAALLILSVLVVRSGRSLQASHEAAASDKARPEAKVSGGGGTGEASAADGSRTAAPLRLWGQVVRASDRMPLEGALVELSTGAPEYASLKVATDREGNFRFESPKPAIYVLSASCRLFGRYQRRIDLRGGAIGPVLIPLRDGKASLAVLTQDEAGKAVPRVSLRVTNSWRSESTIITDDQGSALLVDLPSGEYSVESACAFAASVELAPGQHKEITLVVAGTAAVIGRVLTKSGLPLPGVRVSLTSFAGGGIHPLPMCLVESDPAGNFSIRGMPAGGYQLDALGSVQAKVRLENGETKRIDLEVLDEAWVGPSKLRGTVLEAGTGRPVSNARISAYVRDLGDSETETDAEGRFAFDFPITGRSLSLQAMAVGMKYKFLEVPLDTGDNETVVEMEPAQDEAERPEPLEVRVVQKESGAPVADARVTCWTDSWGSVYDTDSEGRFYWPDPKPGRIDVLRYGTGFRRSFQIDAVGVGEPLRLELSDEDYVSLSGTISDGEGAVRVQLIGGSIAASLDLNPPDASYRFSVPPGSYTLTLSDRRPGWVQVPVTLEGGGGKTLDLSLRRGTLRLSGQVVGPDGLAARLAAHRIRLTRLDASPLSYGNTATLLGRFEFVQLAPGSYELEVLAAGEVSALRERLAMGAGDLEKTLTVPFSATMIVNVQDEAGTTIGSFEGSARLVSKETGKIVRQWWSSQQPWDSELLVPGAYELFVTGEGYADAHKELTIPDRGVIWERVVMHKK